MSEILHSRGGPQLVNSMVYFEIDKIMKSLNFIKKPYKELKNINEDQWRKESEELKKYIFEITNFI